MNEELIEQIEKLKKSGCLIIVEGKKDKNALEHLGLKNEIVTLSKKPIFSLVEDIVRKNKKVAILTDMDKKGRQLYGKLNSNLQQFGVKVDNKFREFLLKETKLRQIEGLVTYLGAF